MAENKRIRVSADTSPLQGLRQEVASMWNDFVNMEGRFKEVSEQALDVIQRQIDLLKERNRLFVLPNASQQGNSLNDRRGLLIDPNTGKPFTQTIGRERLNPLRQDSFVFNKMLSELSRIAEILEKGKRDSRNGAGSDAVDTSAGEQPLPTGTTASPTGGIGSGLSGGRGGFKLPTSLAGLMKGLPFGIGAIAMAIGSAIGNEVKFRTQMYGAENAYERENLRGQHWLLNTITFGISGQMAERREMERRAYQNFDNIIPGVAAQSGMGSVGTTVALLGNVMDLIGHPNSRRGRGNKNLPTYNFANTPPDATAVSRPLNPAGMGGIFEISPESDEALREMGITPIGSRTVTVQPDGHYAASGDIVFSKGRLARKGSYTSRDGLELHNWRTDYLGMTSSDYASKVNNLLAAGMDTRATGFVNGGSLVDNMAFFNDINRRANQVVLWGKARGLSDEQQAATMRTARFDESGVAPNTVISSFDMNLTNMGYRGYARSGRLSENLDTYNKIAQQVLGVAGSVNSEELVRTMTGVQQTTGMQGPQLERIQEFMTGANVSQDEVTRAFMMREARKLNPEATFSELMAMVENPNESGLMQNVVKSLYEETGGGENFRTTLKSVAPGMHWADINELDKSLKNSGGDYQAAIDRMFEGTVRSRDISEEAGANVSEVQRSSAAAEELRITEGADKYLKDDEGKNKEGGDLTAALEAALMKVTMNIVDTSPDRLTPNVLKDSVLEAFTEGLKDIHITME